METDNRQEQEIVTETKSSRSSYGIKNFVAGVALTAVVMTGGYFLVKGYKKDKNTTVPENTKEYTQEYVEEPVKIEEEIQYTFNYDEPVVVASIEEPAEVVELHDSEDTTTVIIEQEEAEEKYEVLTTEEFEKLTSDALKQISDRGITLDESDVIKFMAIINIDKLSQDNTDLLAAIVGNQNPDEVKLDAQKVMGALVMYNYSTYFSEGNNENFIKVSDFIFDKEEKEKAIEIENRVNEIGVNKDKTVVMNELVHSLLRDMLDPTNRLSYVESGTGFGLQLTLEPVRGLYGMDKDFMNITLDYTNADLIKYFVPYAEDEQEYEDNALLTGYIRNINDILNDCTKSKTLTK